MKMPNTCGHVTRGLIFFNYFLVQIKGSKSQKMAKNAVFDPPVPKPDTTTIGMKMCNRCSHVTRGVEIFELLSVVLNYLPFFDPPESQPSTIIPKTDTEVEHHAICLNALVKLY